jgi:1-deoxy-D-xylulose-5-phosphate reductoisomerase
MDSYVWASWCRVADQLVSSVSSSPRRVAVLGSTGSIGCSTLDVIAHHRQRFQVHGLSAHGQIAKVVEQARKFRPRFVVVTGGCEASKDMASQLPGVEVLRGTEGLQRLAADPETDIVVSAIVGAAGLAGTWSAVQARKTVALANKETLVMAGPLVMSAARESGANILPVDSEHSAIFQALAGSGRDTVRRVVLTASGGPFRGKSRRELQSVTAEDALRHPTWQMGPKITVDSATLMNKALEIIEARWLFDLRPDQIEVIIHPESIVHSFVEFVDGSVIAQLSPPDMRLPIQFALTYPERCPGPTRQMDWRTLSALTFEQPDHETFPALQLGFEVAARGGTCGAVLNAANEAAVHRFLAGELPFLEIARVCRTVLNHHNFVAHPTLDDLLTADRWARRQVDRFVELQCPAASLAT